jgi:hypothetical protein
MSESDPVAAALKLRASDSDRERVAALLRDAYVEGRLTAVEHEERIAGVYASTTYGELVPLLEDLPVPPGALAVPGGGSVVAVTGHGDVAGRPDGFVVLDPSRAAQGDGTAVAIFGGVERRGRWVVPPEMTIVCVFGGAEIDFSEAILTSPTTVLRVFCIFGGIDVTVPEGVAVQSSVIAIFGGTSRPGTDAPVDAPVIRVTGALVMGGVDLHRPKKPKKAPRLGGSTDPELGP